MVWRYGTPPNLQIIPKWRVVAVYRVWGLLVQGLNCPRLAKRIFFLSLIHAWYLISYQVPKFIPHICHGRHGRGENFIDVEKCQIERIDYVALSDPRVI